MGHDGRGRHSAPGMAKCASRVDSSRDCACRIASGQEKVSIPETTEATRRRGRIRRAVAAAAAIQDRDCTDATAGDDTTMTSANAQDEADDGERESDHYGDDAPTALWCAYVIARADR